MIFKAPQLVPFSLATGCRVAVNINLSVHRIASRQLKAALALLGWKVSDSAEASGVSEPTIWRLETAEGLLGGKPETVGKLIGALEVAGVEFTSGEQPGVRLRKSAAAAAEPVSKPIPRKATPRKRRSQSELRSLKPKKDKS